MDGVVCRNTFAGWENEEVVDTCGDGDGWMGGFNLIGLDWIGGCLWRADKKYSSVRSIVGFVSFHGVPLGPGGFYYCEGDAAFWENVGTEFVL